MRTWGLLSIGLLVCIGCSGDAPSDDPSPTDTGTSPPADGKVSDTAPGDSSAGDSTSADSTSADSAPLDTGPVDSGLTDAAPADTAVARCDPTKPFGAPVYATDLNLGNTSDEGAGLSADELTVYFDSSRPGGAGCTDVWRATRASRDLAFGAPTAVPVFNTTMCDRGLSITADGLFLYTGSNAPGGSSYSLRVASRANTLSDFGAFGVVSGISVALDGGLSSESSPFVLPDHGALYFSSNRSGTEDLYRATRVGGSYEAAKQVVGVNTASQESMPVVSADEKTIYFASDRPSGLGNLDIYRASRNNTSEGFSYVTNLASVNSDRIEMPTWVSADDCVMYLARHMQTDAGAAHYDIMVAKRPK